MPSIIIVVNSGSTGLGLTPAVIVAIIAAISAIVFSYQTHRRERNRDRVTERIRLQEQASKFAYWVEEDEVFRWIEVRNASDLPIIHAAFFGWNPWPPGKTLEEAMDTAVDTHHEPVLPPEAQVRFDMTRSSAFQKTSVIFTDHQGVLWARHEGKLNPNPLKEADQPGWYRAYEWEPLSPIQSVLSDVRTSFRYVREWLVEVLRVVGEVLGFKKKG